MVDSKKVTKKRAPKKNIKEGHLIRQLSDVLFGENHHGIEECLKAISSVIYRAEGVPAIEAQLAQKDAQIGLLEIEVDKVNVLRGGLERQLRELESSKSLSDEMRDALDTMREYIVEEQIEFSGVFDFSMDISTVPSFFINVLEHNKHMTEERRMRDEDKVCCAEPDLEGRIRHLELKDKARDKRSLKNIASLILGLDT